MENKQELINITNEVISQISDLEVAPPLLYKALFSNLLAEHKVTMEDEDKLVDKILSEKLSKLNSLQEGTSKNITKLDGSTKKAIKAIKDKDSKQLEAVIQEMDELRQEVNKLKGSVFTDMLTKAHNRQWL